ncbi:MAG: SRPBCC family protein [Ignavibacteriales bacterium]|nr:SRPBCC family protein [Ignavibacteriales bacterium]
MIKLEETVEIRRPVHEVYNYVVNLENVQKWQPAVIEVKRLTEGPTRVGTKFSEVAKMMGRRVNTTCEITSMEPNKTLAFKASSDGPLEYETSYAFEPVGTATRLKIVGSFRTKGFWRLLEPLFKGEVKKESVQELTAMKNAIEERTA